MLYFYLQRTHYLVPVVSQIHGVYSLFGWLMSQIRMLDSSDTQLKVNEALISVAEEVNEWYGPQLAFITFGYVITSLNVLIFMLSGDGVISLILPLSVGFFQIFQLLMAIVPITLQVSFRNFHCII